MIKILLLILSKSVIFIEVLSKFFIKIIDDILLLGINIFEILGKFFIQFLDNFHILPRATYHLFRNLDLDNLKDYILTYWLQLLIILIIICCVIMLFSKNKNDND